MIFLENLLCIHFYGNDYGRVSACYHTYKISAVARSEFSRGPHVSKFLSFDFDLCVWMEGEASLPLLPLKHFYTCSTCVCAGCSMAVCPFCHTCHKMLFPLLLEGILFRGELCCALLFLSCLKSIAEEVTEINLDILVLNFLDLDLQNHFNHTIAVTSLQEVKSRLYYPFVIYFYCL